MRSALCVARHIPVGLTVEHNVCMNMLLKCFHHLLARLIQLNHDLANKPMGVICVDNTAAVSSTYWPMPMGGAPTLPYSLLKTKETGGSGKLRMMRAMLEP